LFSAQLLLYSVLTTDCCWHYFVRPPVP